MSSLASKSKSNSSGNEEELMKLSSSPSQRAFLRPGVIEEEGESSDAHDHGRAEYPFLGQQGLGQKDSKLRTSAHSLHRSATVGSSIGHGLCNRGESCRNRNHRLGGVRKVRRRAVLKNGECNVQQSRISQRKLRFLQDIFTTLVDVQWRWTLIVFALSFILSWLGFAAIWWLIAFTHGDLEPAHLPDNQEESNWKPCMSNINNFASCFLFSIETQHTIGYGSRLTTEECPEAIFVMCLQSIFGVMIQAFMVGIVFAKMSRPKHRTQTLLFSKYAIICQRDGDLCLMFRVGDMRKSHIIGACIRAQLIRSKMTKEGECLNQYQTELDVTADGCDSDLFFIWPLTVVHKINSNSPLYAYSASDMLQDRFEIVVILEGTIESTGQTTQARSSYVTSEILWGHRFDPIVFYNKDRQGYEVDYSKFDETTQVDTPLCSGKELAEFYKVQNDFRSVGYPSPQTSAFRQENIHISIGDDCSLNSESIHNDQPEKSNDELYLDAKETQEQRQGLIEAKNFHINGLEKTSSDENVGRSGENISSDKQCDLTQKCDLEQNKKKK